MSEISLEQFILDEITHLTAFRIWYRTQQEQGQPGFPDKLNPGDWFEQIEAYEAGPTIHLTSKAKQ